ncbi:MAG: hypothetical protein Q9214_006678, partial [Letrouitia sp. 1 TL-2023]
MHINRSTIPPRGLGSSRNQSDMSEKDATKNQKAGQSTRGRSRTSEMIPSNNSQASQKPQRRSNKPGMTSSKDENDRRGSQGHPNLAGVASTDSMDDDSSQEQSTMSRTTSLEDRLNDRNFQGHSTIPGLASSDYQTAVQSSRAVMTDGPNIDWMPSRGTYEARVRDLAAQGIPRSKDLPADFPRRIEGARAWTGSEFTKETSFVLQISAEEVREIEKALKVFKDSRSGKDLTTVIQHTFPLPFLGKRLKEMSKTIHSGLGFAVVRGLNPENYSRIDNIIIYLGLTSYIAEIRGRQDSTGSML